MPWQRWRFAISVSWQPLRAARKPAFSQDAYTTVAQKAAALMHLLARNHALVDGNKRLAWAATRVLCLLNGRDLAYAVDDAEGAVLRAAAGEFDVHDLAQWIDVTFADARFRPATRGVVRA